MDNRLTAFRVEVDDAIVSARQHILGVQSPNEQKEQFRIMLQRFPGFLPDLSLVTTDEIMGKGPVEHELDL